MAESKGTILLDMDNTSYGFNIGVAQRLARHGIELSAQIETFYFADAYPEHRNLIDEICSQPDFFASLRLLPGVKQRVREMQSRGYRVQFCSSPLSSNPTCEERKREALERDFDSETATQAFIGKDETIVEGDLLIDDKANLSGSQEPMWAHVLYTQPWNTGLRGRPRINSWKDPIEVLRTIERYAKP